MFKSKKNKKSAKTVEYSQMKMTEEQKEKIRQFIYDEWDKMDGKQKQIFTQNKQ